MHDETCPSEQSINAVLDADRDWFLAHPHADEYHRPITPVEVADLRAAGVLAEPTDCVHVVQLEPGLRSRRNYDPAAEQRDA